ncbi:transposase [Gilvimarinus sp. F26214L]|uniref:transposase n=1 Tax=Gilvimarinus sp. DZF01 TaxID=3461371 RepID=UPI0040454B63
MPIPRKNIVSLEATPYYHVTARCVRRAFLCGVDAVSGRSFEHRRKWIENRILELSQVFSIDICAYAVMSNHFHVVLHVDRDRIVQWSDLEVCQRWHRLCRGTPLSQRFERGRPLSEDERDELAPKLDEWRNRLCSISWFMKLLNEPIAREANREDNCTGKFWESRFKSQALLDEKALAACMTYVDLNPVRAKLADTPEQSEYTSIRRRLVAVADGAISQQPVSLMPFEDSARKPTSKAMPFSCHDYIQLVEWTGRMVREGKRGAIKNTLPPVLSRLQLEPRHWLFMATNFESRFKSMVGNWFELKRVCKTLGYRRTPGLSVCRQLL